MADKEVKITIKAVDEFSKAFNKLDDSLAKAGKASEKLAGAFDDFANASGSSKLKNLSSTFAEIAEGMQTVQGRAGLAVRGVTTVITAFEKLFSASRKNFAEGLQKLGKVASTIGSAIGAVGSKFMDILQAVTGADLSFTGLASTVANFETNMQRANVLTGAGTDGIERLNNKAKLMAMEFGVSIEEVSAGMVEMGSAGFDCGQVLSTIKPIMQMATSGCIDFAKSTEIVANGLNAFKMDKTTADVTKFANTLAYVADESATNIEELGEALKKVGPLAGMAGTGIEDVGALLGIMADNGIKASSAGTSLKNVMSRFASGNSSVTKAIKDYNLAGFEQKMLTGDLAGAMVELCKETEKYNPVQKEAIATALAGAYGMPGLVSLMNKGAEGIQNYVDKIEEQNKLETERQRLSVLSAQVMDTTKGKMSQLTATVGVLASEFKEKLDPYIKGALDGMLGFARSLFDTSDASNVAIKSLSQLADTSKQWGESLKTGIQDAISSIKGFVSGGGLDNLLTIGTNVIQGICKGISSSKANLQQIFSDVIKKACDFIVTNGDAIRRAGKDIMDALKGAIEENSGSIRQAMDSISDIINEWANSSGQLKSTMGTFADVMIDSLIEKTGEKMKNKAGEWMDSLFSIFKPNEMPDMKKGFIDDIVGWLFGEASAAEVKEGSKPIGKAAADGTNEGYMENKDKITQTASQTGTESATAINEALMSMDVGQLQALQNEMTNLGNTSAMVSESMSLSFNNIQNSARTAFMGLANIVRNQMLNVSNIIRNQMLNSTNIVKNQATNMADATRTSFVNMANIARNQFVNIANICRNQMLNCTNIVKNQMTNMNDATRTAFVNMANIVRNQMTNCTNIVRNQASNMSSALSQGMSRMASAASAAMAKVVAAVRSGMAQARAIASAPITINIQSNISRKVTTTHVAGGLKQTMASIGANSLSVGSPNVMSSGGRHTITPVSGNGGSYTFTIPITVDGREIARATAKYNQSELDRLSKRNSRKRGE